MSSWAAQQAWKRAGKAAGLAGMSILASCTALWLWYTNGQTSTLFIAMLCVFGVSWILWLQAAKLWKRSQQAAVGAVSEKRVRATLNKTASVVVHNAMLGAGGDVDHVVLYPFLAVVETKTGKGEIKISGTSLYAGKTKLPKDPVGQIARQGHAFERKFKEKPLCVVCVVDATSKPMTLSTGEIICSLYHLPSVLKNHAPRIPKNLALTLKQRLEK